MFFRINVNPNNEKIHKKICMYGAGVVMALDVTLSAYNYFAAEGAEAATPEPEKKAQNAAVSAAKIAGAEAGRSGGAEYTVASARNPIIHWYEYYFCRGFQSAYGCSQRSLRATTSLDLDPQVAAQNRILAQTKEDKIIRDTYSIDLLDRAAGKTELK